LTLSASAWRNNFNKYPRPARSCAGDRPLRASVASRFPGAQAPTSRAGEEAGLPVDWLFYRRRVRRTERRACRARSAAGRPPRLGRRRSHSPINCSRLRPRGYPLVRSSSFRRNSRRAHASSCASSTASSNGWISKRSLRTCATGSAPFSRRWCTDAFEAERAGARLLIAASARPDPECRVRHRQGSRRIRVVLTGRYRRCRPASTSTMRCRHRWHGQAVSPRPSTVCWAEASS